MIMVGKATIMIPTAMNFFLDQWRTQSGKGKGSIYPLKGKAISHRITFHHYIIGSKKNGGEEAGEPCESTRVEKGQHSLSLSLFFFLGLFLISTDQPINRKSVDLFEDLTVLMATQQHECLTTVLSFEYFPTWLEIHIKKKFCDDIDKIFSLLYPMFLLFSDVLQSAQQLELIIQQQQDPDIGSFLFNVESIIQICNSVALNLPSCPTDSYLDDFLRASSEAAYNIGSFLHPFEHLEVEDKQLSSLFSFFSLSLFTVLLTEEQREIQQAHQQNPETYRQSVQPEGRDHTISHANRTSD